MPLNPLPSSATQFLVCREFVCSISPHCIDIKPTLHNNTKICLLAIYYCQLRLLLFINVLWTNVEFENLSDLNCIGCVLEVLLHDTAYAGMEHITTEWETDKTVTKKCQRWAVEKKTPPQNWWLSFFPRASKVYNFFIRIAPLTASHPNLVIILMFMYTTMVTFEYSACVLLIWLPFFHLPLKMCGVLMVAVNRQSLQHSFTW